MGILFAILYVSILAGYGIWSCYKNREADEKYLVQLLREKKLYFEDSILD